MTTARNHSLETIQDIQSIPILIKGYIYILGSSIYRAHIYVYNIYICLKQVWTVWKVGYVLNIIQVFGLRGMDLWWTIGQKVWTCPKTTTKVRKKGKTHFLIVL